MIKPFNPDKIIFILFVSFLFGCTGNGIYYDADKKAVCTCSGKNIKRLRIKTDKETYSFTLVHRTSENSIFYLFKPNKDYEMDYISSGVNKNNFTLKSNTRYEIVNSTYGDANSAKIVIDVDSLYHITDVTKTKCN